ncbi:MAG TPA: type II toxin-antitoxin system prevent-host-death family antitoxin [Actinomycetales bacterium]|nr:type II toxin-antitoxin system prevent-host-death family antitoxin [Actinomycetales bacterium]
MAMISQRELRNDSGDVLRRVQAGEAITVTRRGVPVVDLVPHRVRARPHRFAPAALVTAALNDLPDWGADDFEREQSELDSHVDDSPRDPWRD